MLLPLRLYRFQHLLEKARLRYRAYNFNAVVHYGLGDALHPVALSHINELRDFDDVSGDVFIFDGKLVGQPGRTWTIGSGWGNKDLNMQVLIDRRQRFARFLAQVGCPFGDIDEVFD
jgi:hypothetical protein